MIVLLCIALDIFSITYLWKEFKNCKHCSFVAVTKPAEFCFGNFSTAPFNHLKVCCKCHNNQKSKWTIYTAHKILALTTLSYAISSISTSITSGNMYDWSEKTLAWIKLSTSCSPIEFTMEVTYCLHSSLFILSCVHHNIIF